MLLQEWSSALPIFTELCLEVVLVSPKHRKTLRLPFKAKTDINLSSKIRNQHQIRLLARRLLGVSVDWFICGGYESLLSHAPQNLQVYCVLHPDLIWLALSTNIASHSENTNCMVIAQYMRCSSIFIWPSGPQQNRRLRPILSPRSLMLSRK